MKLAGAGRILVWRGGSLWIGRAGEATDFHAHHAVQVTLTEPDSHVRFRLPDAEWASYQGVLIAANQAHAFAGDGNVVANVFVEPESRAGQLLRAQYGTSGTSALPNGKYEVDAAALFAAYRAMAADSELIALARAFTARLITAQDAPPALLDPRIARAVDLIRGRIGDELIPLAAIAEAVHLSPDRFRHLFLEQTGVRFRAYILWLRIELALEAYAAHDNLTEASLAGGFADSAHFSRTFKSMFGIAPSAIRID